MATYTYNINTTSVIINTQPITGLADGTSISITFNDSYLETLDSDGITTVHGTNNHNAVATLTLEMWSPSNDLLSNLFNSARVVGLTGFSFRLAGENTRDNILSNFAYIPKLADVVHGNDGQTKREWTINLTDVGAFVGGLN